MTSMLVSFTEIRDPATDRRPRSPAGDERADVAWRLDDLASRNRPCGRDLVRFAGAGPTTTRSRPS